MKKRITVLTMIVFIFLIIFTACTQMDPLGIANGVPEGYTPGEVTAAVVDNNWIFFAENGTIKKMRLDGTGVEVVFTPVYSQGTVWKILLDPVRQKLYIFEHLAAIANNIYQYNLDGTGEVLIASESTSDIMDMSIDHINGYLYYIWNGGVRSVNLDDTTLTADVYANNAIVYYNYVATAFNGIVYYIDGSNFYRVDTPAAAADLVVTPAATAPITLSSTFDGIYLYYYDSSAIYKLDAAAATSFFVVDPSSPMAGNMVLYEKGGLIYFYDDNGGAGEYIIYSINMDGTGAKSVVLNNGLTAITTFDVLAK